MIITEKAQIIFNNSLSEEIYSMKLNSPHVAKQAKPGQFVMIRITNDYSFILPRPFAIADCTKNMIRIVYRVVGKGTKVLSTRKPGEILNVLGPLGKPIPKLKNKKVVLCAGGVGIAPLRFLASKLAKNNEIFLYYGAKTKKELILVNELKPLCRKMVLATEDGSYGKKGVILDFLSPDFLRNQKINYIFASGPLPMLKNLELKLQILPEIPVYGFLEAKMGCGCGLCYCCGVKTREGKYLRICTDGPVFSLKKVDLSSLNK
ncbi:MAG: dihydroorotate dehydrogenase electron transfer subunit [candidate division WOR-3 bacterium]